MMQLAKSVGGVVVGLLFFLAVLLIPVVFIYGGVRVGAAIFPWLVGINTLAVAATIVLFLPNAVFSSTPKFAGGGLVLVSYVFGATVWVWGLLLTYTVWGGVGLFIGLFMAGAGVVPLAVLAMLFRTEWAIVGQLILLVAMAFGARISGYHLLAKAAGNALVAR
jgi:hypothetical protein